MSITRFQADPFSLTSDAYNFKIPEGKQLWYNSKTEQFAIADRHQVTLGKDFTRNLKTISQRVHELVQRTRRDRDLSTTDNIYLTANIQQLNSLFTKHNRKIKSNCWLNFLDYALWTVSFGKKQLSCKLFHATDTNIYKYSYFNVFQAIVQNEKLDHFLDSYGSNILVSGIDRTDFTTLTPQIKQRLLHFTKEIRNRLSELSFRALISLFDLALQQKTKEGDELADVLLKQWEKKLAITEWDSQTGRYVATFFLSGAGRKIYPETIQFFQLLDQLRIEMQSSEKDLKSPEDSKFMKYLSRFTDNTLTNILGHQELLNRPDLARAIITHIQKSRKDKQDGVIEKFLIAGLEAAPEPFLSLIDTFRKESCAVYKSSVNLLTTILQQVSLPAVHSELAFDVFNSLLQADFTKSPSQFGRTLAVLDDNGFSIEDAWKKLSPDLRIKLQEFLQNKRTDEIGTYNLTQIYTKVYAICVRNYQSLTPGEKPGFFLSLQTNEASLQPTRAIFFDFVEHITNTSSHSQNIDSVARIRVIVKKMVNSVTDNAMQKFTDEQRKQYSDEMRKFIFFCSGMNFNVLQDQGKNLRDELPHTRMIQFLAKDINTRYIGANSRLAIQLCVTQAFEGMEKLQKEVMNIFNNLDFYRIPMDMFEKVAFEELVPKDIFGETGTRKFAALKPFVKAIRSEPDTMLATASEEQLEAFYKPLEADLFIDETHLRKQIAQKEAAPPLPTKPFPLLPPNVTSMDTYATLEKMYLSINLTYPALDGYVGDFRSTKGESIDAKFIADLFGKLIFYAKSPAGQVGVPNQNNRQQYLEYCSKISLCMKHTVLQLQKLSAKDRNLILVRTALSINDATWFEGGDKPLLEVVFDFYREATHNIHYEELVEMFNKINFTSPDHPDYMNPERDLYDDGQKVEVSALRNGVVNFIQKAKVPKGYYGIPKPTDDPKGFRTVCNDIDLYLKHSILVLRGRSQRERNLQLIWLAGAGIHCGGKILSVSQDLYSQLTGANYNVDLETLMGVLIQYVTEGRRGILDGRVNKITTETHARQKAMKIVGKRFGIPEANSYQFEDPYDPTRNEWGVKEFADQKFLDELYENCKKDYNPTFLLNTITRRFEGVPGTKSSITPKFRQEAIDAWFVEYLAKKDGIKLPVPDRKKEAELDPAVKELGRIRAELLAKIYSYAGRYRRKWLVKLLLEHKILKTKGWFSRLFSAKNYWEKDNSEAV